MGSAYGRDGVHIDATAGHDARPGVDISRGVSFVGSLIVLAAALLVTATAGERVVAGFAGLGSSDGLTRILSPVVIVIALLALAAALAGVALSWRTLRSLGRQQAAAPVAGVLTGMGTGLTFTVAPATDWQFQALALPLAVIGTGVVGGGWLLGWTSQHLPVGANAVRGLGAAGVATLVTLPLAIGVLMAHTAAEDSRAAISERERAEAISLARTHWDSPVQRITYLDVEVTLARQSVRCGTSYTVEAFTLFGLRPEHVHVDDCGVN